MVDERTARQRLTALRDNLARVILGKEDVIELVIITLLSRGHLLIEDLPGVGKTTLAHGLARSIDCSFQRIQFTSDLLPSDVIGVNVYNRARGEFEFMAGPIFANIVLADEINRATPKTQSALLEAMNDRQVTIERKTFPLPDPFMLLATQNPVEYSGTFPLPESQLDRFLLRVRMGYPSEETEKRIMQSRTGALDPQGLSTVIDGEELRSLQAMVEEVRVDDAIVSYAMRIISATRSHEDVRLGVSPRGAMALYRAAQASALVDGRTFCTPDDVKRLAVGVLAHRIVSRKGGFDEDATNAEAIVNEIIGSTAVPL